LNTKAISVTLLTVLLFCGVIVQAVTVNAQYPYRYRLTITNNNYNGGYTSPSGTIQIDSGLSYQVTATPNPGYVFSGWYLDGIYQNKLSTITVTMLHDTTLQATFSQQATALEVSVNPPEAGTTNPAPGVLYYPYGNNVQVTIQPNAGYTFNCWFLDGSYAGSSTTITVSMTGNKKVSAYFGTGLPNATTPPAPTPTPTPSVTLPTGDLTVSCQSSSTYDSFNVKINGLLTAGGTSVPNAGILLYLSVDGGNAWDVLSFVNTDSNGAFTVTWKPSVTGNYILKAVWSGNSAYSSTTEIVNFAIAPFEQESVFSVTSNSTLSGLAFDSEAKTLSFSTDGPSGSTGYVNVVIPKSLVADISAINVFLDGNEINYNSASQSDSWALSLTYQQSSHNLRIGLNEEASTQSSNGLPMDTTLIIGALVAVIVALAVVVTVLFRKRSPKAKQD
jgi:uncharacterized repeat protein (TIGR02543 family)